MTLTGEHDTPSQDVDDSFDFLLGVKMMALPLDNLCTPPDDRILIQRKQHAVRQAWSAAEHALFVDSVLR